MQATLQQQFDVDVCNTCRDVHYDLKYTIEFDLEFLSRF
jgi:hypothetical protein